MEVFSNSSVHLKKYDWILKAKKNFTYLQNLERIDYALTNVEKLIFYITVDKKNFPLYAKFIFKVQHTLILINLLLLAFIYNKKCGKYNFLGEVLLPEKHNLNLSFHQTTHNHPWAKFKLPSFTGFRTYITC